MSTRFCKSCGARLPEDAGFCEECGARVEAVPEPRRPSTYRQPAAPQEYSAPPRKRGARPGLIILVVILLVAALVVLWVTGVIGGGKPVEPQHTSSVSATSPATRAPDATRAPIVTPAPAATRAPVVTPAPAQPAPAAGADLSTTDIPAPEDFTWFTDGAQDWVFGILPLDAEIIGASVQIGGSWKGLEMIYDYDGSLLGCSYFTMTFDTSSTDTSADATLDWHYTDWSDGAREDISSWADDTLSGNFELPTFSVGVPGNLIDLICYERGGRQYAEGIWTVQSGEEVRVALTRP